MEGNENMPPEIAETFDTEPPYDKNLKDEDVEALIDKALNDVDDALSDDVATEETPATEESNPEPAEPEKEIPPEAKDSLEQIELKMYKKMFEDADNLAKDEMYGSLMEKIASEKGVSVEEYKNTLGGAPTKAEPAKPSSTNEIIASLLKQKEQGDVAEFKKVDPNTTVKSLDDLADKDTYIKLVDSGIKPSKAYLIVQEEVVASRKPKADDNKTHMRSSASKQAGGNPTQITAGEISRLKDSLGWTESEIIEYYKKTNK